MMMKGPQLKDILSSPAIPQVVQKLLPVPKLANCGFTCHLVDVGVVLIAWARYAQQGSSNEKVRRAYRRGLLRTGVRISKRP